ALRAESAHRPTAGVRNEPRIGIDLFDLRVPEPPKFEQPLLPPHDILPPRLIPRVCRARQFQSGKLLEVLPAVLAVAHAGTSPAIAEYAVHVVPADDLAGDFVPELLVRSS